MLTFGSTLSLWGQGLSVTFTPSMYNGYNISCFGKKDGSIDVTVTGGVPPYTYQWSTGDRRTSPAYPAVTTTLLWWMPQAHGTAVPLR